MNPRLINLLKEDIQKMIKNPKVIDCLFLFWRVCPKINTFLGIRISDRDSINKQTAYGPLEASTASSAFFLLLMSSDRIELAFFGESRQ